MDNIQGLLPYIFTNFHTFSTWRLILGTKQDTGVRLFIFYLFQYFHYLFWYFNVYVFFKAEEPEYKMEWDKIKLKKKRPENSEIKNTSGKEHTCCFPILFFF